MSKCHDAALPAGQQGRRRRNSIAGPGGTPRAGQIWDVWSDDVEFTGTLIIALVAIEILGQLPLLARVMRALPEETRAALSRHPRHPWLAMFGSARFFLALLGHRP